MKQKITITIDEKLIEAIKKAAKKEHRNTSQEFEKALMAIYLPNSKEDDNS